MAASTEQPLLVDRPRDGVLRLSLNRPGSHNAIDPGILAALHAALDQPRARAVVLCSTTPGMFCAGADLSLDDAVRAAVSDGLYALYRRMIDLDLPIVAALTGPAVGGGAQLAIASDLRVAEDGAWVRFVGPAHGLAVGAWGLPALIGRGRAMDLCLSGRRVQADEALAIGLVDRVADDAAATALDLAAVLAELDQAAVARAKAIVTRASSEREALELEAQANRSWGGSVATT